ncbi:hypothetical protein [Actinoplanes sp. NPDC051494]|uniref:hypothetical protein n=1 Tax=Actinoplanes sp. NPDC051494 TaxID=3363907 RepID=UPI0037A6AD10
MTTTDERDAAELLGPLAADPPPGPSRVDVAETMRAGARRRRNRRVSSALAFTAVALVAVGGGSWAMASARRDPGRPLVPPAASTAPAPRKSVVPRAVSCEVTRLPTGGIEKAVVSGADPSGRWIVGRTYPTRKFSYPLAIWKDSKLVESVEMPGQDQHLYDINSNGDAVGSSFGDSDHETAYAYVGGKLRTLKGGNGTAGVITESGRIGGRLNEPGALEGRAVVWDSASAEPELVPLPPGTTESGIVGIGEDGTVVFTAGTDDGRSTGYLWLTDGTIRKLPLPAVDTHDLGRKKATSFSPDAINGGWVSGTARYENEQGIYWSGYRYRIADGRTELLGDVQNPDVIAANGWIASGGSTPVLFTGDTVVKLPGYGKGSREAGYEIRGISDDGRTVAGYQSGVGLTNHPLVWRCE